MKKLYKGMLAGAALLVAPFTQAAVIEWGYTVTLEWSGPATFANGGANSNAFQDATLLSWGAAGGDHTVLDADPGDARSALEITDTPAIGTIFTNDVMPEATNTLTHFNNRISLDFDALVSGSVLTTLNLTPIDPLGGPADELSTVFLVNFYETPNAEPCGFPTVAICDDIFVLQFGALDQSFEYDGVTYFINIIETSGVLGPLPDATCAAAGAASGCVGFTTEENAITDIQFGFTIFAVDVPEPAMLGLFGLGLLGLRAFGRRRLVK